MDLDLLSLVGTPDRHYVRCHGSTVAETVRCGRSNGSYGRLA